ncbi:TetR/AcrR family transcriptional regulator [Pigmentiphaga soli]|uniref:TetR/AcrR family transcriptional regulator n=1 Tax=Pigmentiphaga soli TaxID=1007095 RepID=A0ABP8HJ60_9BURK
MTQPSDPAPGTRWSGRRAEKETRRETILQSVCSVLARSRLSSLTMQEIADELGITKGNLYYYFRDKQDILYQAHMRSMETSLRALRAAQESKGSCAARLRQLLIDHIEGILRDGLGNVLLTDLESLHPEQRSHYIAKRDEFERGVRALIDEGLARGEFHYPDTKLASLAMLGSINWISKWYRPEGPMTADAVAAGMADFLMNALACPPGARAER